jgi:hypothetical protein
MPRGIPKSGKRVPRSEGRRAARPAIIDPNQFYSIDETAAARDQSPASLWKDIARGALAVVRDGKRVKVFGAEIIRSNQVISNDLSCSRAESVTR